MMDTDERAEVEAERQEREQAHRKWVRETFARGRVPEGMDPWEVGVVVIYTRGSARDYGRIHRASCRHVRNTVNASWSTRSSIYTYDTFWDRPGYSGQPSTCKTCGTDDRSQLLRGGNYFGEPQESIDRRLNNRRHQDRLAEVRRYTEYAESEGHREATRLLLERHQAEYDSLVAECTRKSYQDYKSKYPNLPW
jgi:hypothetical protein